MNDSATVQLEDFVATALAQIVSALKKAAPHVEAMGGVLVPRVRGGPETAAQAGHLRSVRRVPVAVTATSGEKAEAGVGVLAGVFGVGVKAKEEQGDSRVSRIAFSIPIELPSSEPYSYDPKADADNEE